jgi:Fic family protein
LLVCLLLGYDEADMNFSFNYNIGEDLARHLEMISHINGNLQVLRMNPDWATLLETKARIREAVSSIGVEGTVVSLEQARAITQGHHDIKIGEKEKREFVGYYDTLQYIKDHLDDKLSLKLLLTLHEMITRGDAKALPGKIKAKQNYVSRGGKIVYTPPPPEQMGFLLDEFFKWFNAAASDKELSPVLAGAICHFWFVWIHPFADGNGRASRILTAFLLLKKKSEGIRYFALSDYYNRFTSEYTDALGATNTSNPKMPAMRFTSTLNPWIQFFVKSYYEQMEEVKQVTDQIFQFHIRVAQLRDQGLITPGQDKVLSFLSKRERASYRELAVALGVSKARIEQILKPLRRGHVLVEQRIGSEIWFSLGSPEIEPDQIALRERVKKAKQMKRGPKSSMTQGVLPIFKD